MRYLVTGSAGLIGSEAVMHFATLGVDVHGIDNNMRKFFFGDAGDISWNRERIQRKYPNYVHHPVDIRNYDDIEDLFRNHPFDAIIHCAAQPSHDMARNIPRVDFEVNANGTINLLEATRRYCPHACFIYMSTNKVYGDTPNRKPLIESDTRYDYADKSDFDGIDEQCPIDQCMHSLFGASKLAGDIVAQEYGRYFKMKVGIFRGGCLTGPQHSGVELHGFLSYLVKAAIHRIPYTVYGYKGKQVRDNIHSKDVIRAIEQFIDRPVCGEVFNLGGGRKNAVSILEAISMIEEAAGVSFDWSYDPENRIGDHICYISDLKKIKTYYPDWDVTIGLEEIIQEMIVHEKMRKN